MDEEQDRPEMTTMKGSDLELLFMALLGMPRDDERSSHERG